MAEVSPAWLHPKEPDDTEVEMVLRTAGLGKFMPMFPFGTSSGEEKRLGGGRRPPERTREKWVGPYYVKMEGRRDSCMIRLYVYIFKTGSLALKGTWSGYDLAACDAQFQKTVDSATASLIRRATKTP